MGPSPIWDALAPLAARTQRLVREHEILRVAANISGKDISAAGREARRQVLIWAERRSGSRFSKEAWEHQAFEHFSGGRNSIAIRIEGDGADIWAIRADDPDKQIPGRIWTTEVVVGMLQNQTVRFSARLLASSSEDELDIEPHVPGFVQQVTETCGLSRGDYNLSAQSRLIDDYVDADNLCEMLVDPDRKLPLFVLTVPEHSTDQTKPLLDANALARATVGIALVAVVPAQLTWVLTERFGKQRSVFGGGARAYLPGFAEDASPYDHRLAIADNLLADGGPKQCVRWMRTLAANESIRQARIGHEVLAFAAIRNSSLKLRQQQLATAGASDVEQLEAAQLRIATLEKQVEDGEASLDYFSSEHSRAEQRAKAAEEQQRASAFRVQQLLDQIKSRGETVDENIPLPDNWIDFANWCDVNLSGRVVLTPAARRSVRSPAFAEASLAARCLVWLANEGRDARINGGEGSIQDEPIEDGIRNAHCGNDAFDFDWQANRYTADWHIKNGGNTRDPARCLRIYYAWDASTQQFIIADMPSHRRTGAS